MDAETWNQAYLQQPLIWKAAPNRLFSSLVAGLTPGKALDLGAGEGGNAVWLAEQGWSVTAVDFSTTALERAGALARDRGVELDLVEADVLSYQPEDAAFDLVALLYLQLPMDQLKDILKSAVRALAPDGHLIVIAHDVRNLEEGVGGPQDARVLLDPKSAVEQLADLEIVRTATVTRSVEGADRPALDALIVARRPSGTSTKEKT